MRKKLHWKLWVYVCVCVCILITKIGFMLDFFWCFWSRTVFVNIPKKSGLKTKMKGITILFIIRMVQLYSCVYKEKKAETSNKQQTVKYGSWSCTSLTLYNRIVLYYYLKANLNKWNVYINFGILLIFYLILTSIAWELNMHHSKMI